MPKYFLILISAFIFGCNSSNTIIFHNMEFVRIPSGKYFISNEKVNKTRVLTSKTIFYKEFNSSVIYKEILLNSPIYVSKFEFTNKNLKELDSSFKIADIDLNKPACFNNKEDLDKIFSVLNQSNKYKVDIPFDYEWEIAYQYKNNLNFFYWGNTKRSNEMNKYAWTPTNTTKLMDVGTKLPNKLGLFDLNGNAKEICKFDKGFCIKGGKGVEVGNPHLADELFMLPFAFIETDILTTKDNIFGVRLVLLEKEYEKIQNRNIYK